MQPFADLEVVGVVDGGLGAQRPAYLVVLLDLGVLVVHVQRRDDPFGEHPGAKPPRCVLVHAALEDQLHLVGPAQVQVIADDVLEEDPARLRTVQHLGQREFRLQDRDVVTVAGLAIRRGVGVRQLRQPLTQQGVDFGRRQAVADLLQTLGGSARKDAVVKRFESDAFLGQLPLHVFVTVDAQLGVVGKVRTELEEEGTEVLIHAVKVQLIYHRGALDDPGVLLARGVGALFRAEDGDLFLGFAEEQDAFGPLKAGTMFRGDIVFALPLAKLHDRNVVFFDEGIDLAQELVAHDSHQRRGSHRLAAMEPEKARGLFCRLQLRLIDVQVHAIDTFDCQGHVLAKDVGDAARYTHDWLRSTPILRDHYRLERSNNWGCDSRPRTIDRSLSIDRNLNTPRRSEAKPR